MAPIYTFTSTLWEPPVEPAWVFATVPPEQSDEIMELTPDLPGFGSVRVAVIIGSSEWKTSLFPSKQAEAYVLPIKRPVRIAEGLDVGDEATITIEVLIED